MTDKILLQKGFKQFLPNRIVSNNIEICFQKRYDDNIGKRYFITINKWKPIGTDPASYEYTTQFYNNINHDAINMTFHNSWKLEDVETYLNKLWETGLFDYYERFNEV